MREISKNDMLVCIVEPVTRLRDGRVRPVITVVRKAPWFVRLWIRSSQKTEPAEWNCDDACVIEASAAALHQLSSVGFAHIGIDPSVDAESRTAGALLSVCLDDNDEQLKRTTEVPL